MMIICNKSRWIFEILNIGHGVNDSLDECKTLSGSAQREIDSWCGKDFLIAAAAHHRGFS